MIGKLGGQDEESEGLRDRGPSYVAPYMSNLYGRHTDKLNPDYEPSDDRQARRSLEVRRRICEHVGCSQAS